MSARLNENFSFHHNIINCGFEISSISDIFLFLSMNLQFDLMLGTKLIERLREQKESKNVNAAFHIKWKMNINNIIISISGTLTNVSDFS